MEIREIKINATEELNTTYRLCGKTSRIFTLKKKNEVNRRLRATQPDGAGRDGMWHPRPPATRAAHPALARAGPAETTCAHSRQRRPIALPRRQTKTTLFFFQFTIFADFYYFFAFRYFIFQLMCSATHLLCLTPFDLSSDHMIDNFRYFLSSEENCRVRRYRVGLITFKQCLLFTV